MPPPVPRPTCPKSFLPHAQTSPFVPSASECVWPAATALMGGSPMAFVGLATGVLFVLPVPSWPDRFCPQPQTSPFFCTNSEW